MFVFSKVALIWVSVSQTCGVLSHANPILTFLPSFVLLLIRNSNSDILKVNSKH